MEEARIDEIADQVLSRRRLTGQGDLRIESSVIDPVVSSQDFVRFEIPRGKGILDSDTAIQISLTNSDTGNTGSRSYLSILNGIKGTINKAQLRIGGKVIATSEEYNFLSATKAAMTPQDDMKSIDSNLEGSMYHFQNLDQFQESTQPAALNYSMNGSVIPGSNHFQNDAGNVDGQDFLVDEHLLPQPTAATTPKFMVRLHDLFPFLKSLQLPLFVMPEQTVFVELFFQNVVTNPFFAVQQAGAALGASVFSIVTDDLKMFATYQFFDDAVMNRIQQRYDTQGLSFIYEDYQFVRKGLPAAANPTDEQELVTDIGGQNKVIRDILIHSQGFPGGGVVIPGFEAYKCQGRAINETADGVAEESYQFEINDQLYFTRPINQQAALNYYYSQVGDAGDSWIPKPVASFENGLTGSSMLTLGASFEGDILGEMTGQYAPRGISFRKDRSNAAGNGKLIGSKPVRMIYNRRPPAGAGAGGVLSTDHSLAFRIWLVVERGFVLRNGEVAVSG